jgi:hypothetical protein
VKRIIFSFLLLLVSCKSDVSTYIPFVDGYWEIVNVTKDQKKVKEYKLSGSVDYFNVNTDLTGFRKKVTPKFDGTFEISQHISKFNLIVEDRHLWLIYSNNNVSYREEIIRANNSSLIISNSDGFIYTYKPYEPLIFE